jgi:hypothetical protein
MSEISLVPPRVSCYTSGLSLLPPPSPTYSMDTPVFAHIENCLRLLEAFLLSRWKPADDDEGYSDPLSARLDDLAKGLLACCIAADVLMRDPKSEHLSTLGASIALTHSRTVVNLL